MNVARRMADLGAFPPTAPARAMRLVRHAGFIDVVREDVKIAVVYENVAAYLDYGRAFGQPVALSPEQWARLDEAIAIVQSQGAKGGPVGLDRNTTYITARRPPAD